ncbi:o-succinylbenzoate synthase [Actinomycetes bacterium]|nr:o-succinylbenzoate synthase [Actinomycetota bacterium]GDX21699.1 o-succinylbenzoate synthase [Actinomycetes bacterium]
MLDLILDSLRVVSLPMKVNFRGINHREVALFQGPQGWAEFSPFLEYSDEESARWLACAIEAATQAPPTLYRSSVGVNATMPALNGESEIAQILAGFPGCTTVKIKVGTNEKEDLERIATVRKLSPQSKIRIDVNGLWSVDHAAKFLELCGEIEYVEQPCATVAELRELKSRVDVKIVGDEILRKSTNLFEIDLNGAIDILMLKVQPLGGIKNAHALAAHHKMPVIVSSALESAVGINYGLTLAASFEEMSYDCGLGTGSLLAKNVADIPIVDGKMQIQRVEPNFDGLETSADRFDWWKNRIMRTAALLG